MNSNNNNKNTTSPIRLGILQAGRAPEEMTDTQLDYDMLFEHLLGETEFEYKHWPVLDNVFPDSIQEADAWLITGSRHGAYEPHDWIPPLEQLIRDVYQAGNPMVGICFGHQIIAQALGGKVEKFAGGWSVGRTEYALESSVFGEGSKDGLTPLLAFHQDQVTRLPESAVNIGSTDFCQNAALLYGDKMLTIQPHPEFNQDFIAGLLATRGGILPPDIKQKAQNSLDLPITREPIAQVMRQFLKRESC